jgi:hypothetical protein
MKRKALVSAALVAALAPVAASAVSRISINAPATMRIGGAMSRISASTASSSLSLAGNTCYHEPETPSDVLRKQYYGASVYSTGAIIAIDVYAKTPGTCTFTFESKGETNAVTISVPRP